MPYWRMQSHDNGDRCKKGGVSHPIEKHIDKRQLHLPDILDLSAERQTIIVIEYNCMSLLGETEISVKTVKHTSCRDDQRQLQDPAEEQ